MAGREENVSESSPSSLSSTASMAAPIQSDEHFRECFKMMNEFRYLQNSDSLSCNSLAANAGIINGGFLCDVEILVDDRTFPCHRVILAAAIPYFRSMFSSGMLETKQRQIEIKDINARTFEELLNYVYTGSLSITMDRAQALLYAASILQMDRVCSACEEFLIGNLTTKNCLAIRGLAQAHNHQRLLGAADTFTMDHFEDLRQSDEFMRIEEDHLAALLSSSDLNVASESGVYDTVINWVMYDVVNRRDHLPMLLSKVRLCQLSAQYLMEHVRRHPLIKDSETCRDLVTEALAKQLVMTGVVPRSELTVAEIDEESSRARKSVAGVIFCVGGEGTKFGERLRSVVAYDCRRNRWVNVSEMNTKRRSFGVVSAFGKLYAIGGDDGLNGTVEVFNPETNTWSSVSSMSTRRYCIGVGHFEGAVYAVGGYCCDWLDTVERYDIEANRWQEVAHTNVRRTRVGVATLGKYVYAVGGRDGTGSLDSCERYDPVLNKWTIIAPMTHRRAYPGVAVLNGYLHAVGGYNDDGVLATCERYNPQSNTWTPCPSMSSPRESVGVAALGGRLYAVGGYDGDHYLASVEAYDPSKNAWESVAPIMQGRACAGVAWCDCSIDSIHAGPM